MKLNYKKVGESGQPVLIVHGVFGSLDNWLTISKTISDKGYVVYILDQRNHGRSPHSEEFDYAAMAKDLREFIEDHSLESPVLIGHSMGGKTVMEYAKSYPGSIDKLIVVDIGPKAYPIHHTEILKGLNAVDIDGLENRKQAEEQLGMYEPNKTVQQFLLKNLFRTDDGKFAWRFNLPVLTRSMGNVGDRIESETAIEVPTLFIRGERSDYIKDEDWKDIQTLFSKAILTTIPNAGHWVQSEQPVAFIETVLQFLEDAR